MRSIAKRLVLTLALAAVSAAAAPALAAAYTTNITSPGPGPLGPNYLTYSYDAGTTFDIEGTTDLADGSKVDIGCYYGDSVSGVAFTVNVSAGHFSVPDADPSTIALLACTLRAVQDTDSAPDLSNKTGPLLGVGDYDYDFDYLVSGGPNSGKHTGFSESQAGTRGQSAFTSIGDTALDQSYADPTSSNPLFNDAGYFAPVDGTGARSLLRIDGTNAFFSAQIAGLAASVGDEGSDEANLPDVGFTRSQDAATGNVALLDSEGIVVCSNGNTRASGDCTAFQDSHVKVNRTVEIDHDGQQQVVTDVFTSTDGNAHGLDGIYENDTTTDTSGWQFPGDASYSTRTAGTTVAVPDAAPQSVLVRYDASDDSESVDNPRGAITEGAKPDSYRFLYDGSLGIGYTRTVPATGSLVIKQVFSTAVSNGDLAALRADAEDRATSPTLTITSPADGARVGTPRVAVTGTVADVGGVTSLTLNGAPVAVAANGTWASTVGLRDGANAITAQAADRYGNTATASITVTLAGGDLTAPVITKAKLSRKKFRVGKKATAKVAARRKRTKTGSKLTYTVSEDATVTVTVSRESKGRRVGRKCRVATRKRRSRKACTRLKLSGTLRRGVKAGKRSLTFSGRIGKKALKTGRYRMTLLAADRAGNKSKPVSLRFRIVKR